MFTYGEKNSADEMRTAWEKAIQNIGISLGQDIITELWTRELMVILEPTLSQEILYIHLWKFQPCNTNNARLREARNKVLESLAADAAISNLVGVLKIAEIQN